MSDLSQVFEVDDIFILLKISAGYFKYFVHALHERPLWTGAFLCVLCTSIAAPLCGTSGCEQCLFLFVWVCVGLPAPPCPVKFVIATA